MKTTYLLLLPLLLLSILLLSLLFTSLPWIPHFKKKYGGFKIEVPKMSDALEWKIYSIFFVISLILISLAPAGAIILRINQFVYLLHLD